MILESLTSNFKVKRLLRKIWGIDKINEKLSSKQRVYMIYVMQLKSIPQEVVYDADQNKEFPISYSYNSGSSSSEEKSGY